MSETIALRVSVVPADGHQAHSQYADVFWTPVLGPGATLLWRRLATRHGETIDLLEVGREIGITKANVVRRLLDRLASYHVVSLDDSRSTAWVRSAMPSLSVSMQHQLPDSLKARHASPFAA